MAAEPAPGGLFGQNVFVTSTHGEFVLRGCPHAAWQFPKERFFARVLHERSRVPVPWPYRLEPSPDIFGWSYAILPKLPGMNVALPDARAALTAGEHAEIAAALGVALAELHTVVWDVPGDYDPSSDAIRAIDGRFEDRVVARLRDRLVRCREASDATTDDDVRGRRRSSRARARRSEGTSSRRSSTPTTPRATSSSGAPGPAGR